MRSPVDSRLHSWIEDDFKNLEEFMQKRGTPVERVVKDGVAADAASRTVAALGDDGEDDVEPTESSDLSVKPIDGISDDQALRIREAVQAAKRRRRQEGQGDQK